jgi:hypothetical protein
MGTVCVSAEGGSEGALIDGVVVCLDPFQLSRTEQPLPPTSHIPPSPSSFPTRHTQLSTPLAKSHLRPHRAIDLAPRLQSTVH